MSFEIDTDVNGFGTLKIDGQKLSGVSRIFLDIEPDSPTLLEVDFLVPGKVSGRAEVDCNFEFLNDNPKLKHQLYEQLKEEFE